MAEIVFLGENEEQLKKVFTLGRRERIEALAPCAGALRLSELKAHEEELKSVKYIFSTWGMPALTKEQIRTYFPSLECVFYAAGSVQAFAREFLECGVRVFCAASVNAVPVAETVFAQITLANKGFFQTLNKNNYEEKLKTALEFCGNFEATVGLIGMGAIGTLVAEKLKALSVRVIAYDKFLSAKQMKERGAEKVELYELFEKSDVISNHLADNEHTRGMLDYKCFSRMKTNSVFINSGRGRQLVEADLIRALTEEQNRFAILDVTYPEPPAEDSPLYSMKNVLLTPHIDGSWGNEVVHMADCVIETFEKVKAGENPKTEVTLEMLATMA